jgi:hypothetical protein
LGVLRPPRQANGEVRREAQTDRGAKALRPRADGTQWGLGPVLGSDGFAHLATARQPVTGSASRLVFHVQVTLLNRVVKLHESLSYMEDTTNKVVVRGWAISASVLT